MHAGSNNPEWLDTTAYPFQRRSLQTSRGKVHFVDEGGGETLLFAHGTPTWSFEYRHLIRAFSATHRCVAPDHLGFGLSERPQNFSYTPEAHAGVISEFVSKLGLREVTLVVHDFGGPIGLPLALRGDGIVKRVVVLNSWMWPFADDRSMQRKARFAASWLGKWMYRRLNASLKIIAPSAYGDRKKLTKEIHGQYLAVFPDADSRERVLWALACALEGSSAHYASLWEHRAKLAALPVEIIWGRKDSAFPPYMLSKWREAVPHAKVVELASAGHWPHEEEPDKVIEAMREFLAQGAGARAG